MFLDTCDTIGRRIPRRSLVVLIANIKVHVLGLLGMANSEDLFASTSGDGANTHEQAPSLNAQEVQLNALSATKSATNRSLSISARLGQLQFHHSGKFRILQLTDIQASPRISPDTTALIEAAIDVAHPDICVFTGNQIAGYDEAFRSTFRKRRWSAQIPRSTEQTKRRVLELTRSMIEPLVKHGIPWVATFGNHDFQCGLTNEQINDLYATLPGCLNPPSDSKGLSEGHNQYQHSCTDTALPHQTIYATEAGSFALPVNDDSGQNVLCSIVLLNSGDYAHSGGYGVPSEQALALLPIVAQQTHKPYIAFQHMPTQQFYQLLREVPSTTQHAMEGYRTFSSKFFVLDSERVHPNSYLGEGISCSDADCGEFDILRRTGCFALSVGHDHRNGFAGAVHDMLLVASPTSGFNSYGPAPEHRAARLFEFDLRHPYQPRTQLLEFGELVGKSRSKKNYTYELNAQLRTEGQEIDLLKKPGLFSKVAAWWRMTKRGLK